MTTTTFLPETGRGTSEAGGGAQAGLALVEAARDTACPSTILRMVPLPGTGRN